MSTSAIILGVGLGWIAVIGLVAVVIERRRRRRAERTSSTSIRCAKTSRLPRTWRVRAR